MNDTTSRFFRDLVYISSKANHKITLSGITRFMDEWRTIENNLTYRGHSERLTQEYERRLQEYLRGGSDADIAARLGMNKGTFSCWRIKQNLPPLGRLAG